MYLALAFGLFGLTACLGPKQAPQTQPQARDQAAHGEDSAVLAFVPNEASADVVEPADADVEPKPGPELEKIEPEAEPEPPSPPPVFEPEPQDLLESALRSCQSALEDWKRGGMDDALDKLDRAFELLLQIRDDESLDILQEKEDLRYLISKRIVEIYASQQAVVGDVRKSIPMTLNSYVEREIKSFQTAERRFFIDSYFRSGRYRPMILDILAEEGLPEQLSWLPLIESGFKTSALSRARALGLWQFIPSTGYRYGLQRNQWVDERMDPEKATRAAIAYLQDLHGLFGDWLTAIAAYNCGEGRVLRAIKSQHINYLDNFWDLYEKLPYETARYVPRFLATLLILEDPEKYGFELPDPDEAEAYEVVEVSKSVRLSDLDEAADAEPGTMRALNPELRYKITLDDQYQLKVPVGATDRVRQALSEMPAWRLPADAYTTHRVRRGDTLSTIARRYNTSVKRIVAANGMRNRHRIWPGQRLKIPGRGEPVALLASQTDAPATYRVRRGDSLWEISKKFGVSIPDLRRWNRMSGNALKVGQTLVTRDPELADQNTEGDAESQADGEFYTVQKGDTLDKIAKKHGILLAALLKANNLGKRDLIFPNQKLILPNRSKR